METSDSFMSSQKSQVFHSIIHSSFSHAQKKASSHPVPKTKIELPETVEPVRDTKHKMLKRGREAKTNSNRDSIEPIKDTKHKILRRRERQPLPQQPLRVLKKPVPGDLFGANEGAEAIIKFLDP